MMTAADAPDLRIFLVRHAHSGWALPGMRDFDRPLDQKGAEEAGRLARIIATNGFQPGLIICSPAARCLGTLAILAPHLTAAPVIEHESDLYSGSSAAYLDVIAARERDAGGAIMLIGHNPMLEETAQVLLADDPGLETGRLSAGFPTAGLLVVDAPGGAKSAVDGRGRFVGLLSPSDA